MIFSDVSLHQLLPPSLKDENFIAFSKIFDHFHAGFSNLLENTIVYPHSKCLSSSFINLLGLQFHVELFHLSAQDNKPDLVMRSFLLHKFKGTNSALATAISLLLSPTTISEWFQYGGKPYFFKPIINFDDARLHFSNDDKQTLIAVINEFKNARSWLDKIVLTSTFDDSLNVTDSFYFDPLISFTDHFFNSPAPIYPLFHPFTFGRLPTDIDDIVFDYTLNIHENAPASFIQFPFTFGFHLYGDLAFNDSSNFNISFPLNDSVSNSDNFDFKFFKFLVYGKFTFGSRVYGKEEVFL